MLLFAIDLKDDLKIEDGIVLKDGIPAQLTDVSLRTDLPKDHPFYNTRALRVVPAGMPDCIVIDGLLCPTVDGIKPAPEPIDPIDPEPIDRGLIR